MPDQIFKPAPISGFPEWLPEVRIVEQRWLDHIRASFERYGFCSVETPSVEALDALLAKGETSQEVYTLHRLQADPEDTGGGPRLGLHFDLTVPTARYVAQHFNDLVFPFKRYQIQRVWRGERPQEGRYREFTQCDVDVIDVDQVSLQYDAELARIMVETLNGLGLPAWRMNINNRKVLQGFYEGLGIADPMAVLRAADKLDKIGPEGVGAILAGQGLTGGQVSAVLDVAGITGTDASVVDRVAALGVKSDLLTEGLDELALVLRALADLPAGSIRADLSIARGLDYYTGTVYESEFLDWPGYGSICSGGRYADLAGTFIRRNLPGVGISIGLTRIFAKLVAEGLLEAGPKSPTQVLVALPAEARREVAAATARGLRARGIRTEEYAEPDKLGKQLRYATRKGIRYVWFPPFEDGGPHEVKDLESTDQVAADPAAWVPA